LSQECFKGFTKRIWRNDLGYWKIVRKDLEKWFKSTGKILLGSVLRVLEKRFWKRIISTLKRIRVLKKSF